MQEELKKRGIKFHKHKALHDVCQPDIVILKNKLVIFCDGNFWHANPEWLKRNNKTKLTKPQEINVQRDKLQNKILKENGWQVLRFWETDILNNVSLCVDEIEKNMKD